VHVWRIRLEVLDAYAESELSADERARARRFRFERDRVAWAGSRAWLRRILANYLGRAPGELVFSGGARDKPTLVSGDSAWLRFNVSHSSALGLVAVSANNDVGVDVERVVDDDRDLVEIAGRVFCAPAVEAVVRAAVAERPAVFYRTWVRNEARVKCEGSGLTDPDDPGRDAVDGATNPRPVVLDLEVGDGYMAALAARSAPQAIRLWAPA
jgi:4'-phosphopantetheinyl transferase